MWGVFDAHLATPRSVSRSRSETDGTQRSAENDQISESGGVKSFTYAVYFVSRGYSKAFYVRGKCRTSACTVGRNNIHLG